MLSQATISASEFKAKCLDILDQLSARKLTQVTITKHGRPVAILTPPDRADEAVRQLYGFMEGSVHGIDGYDLTAPVIDEPFSADNGKIHQ
jgi:prevent-host-death family protein